MPPWKPIDPPPPTRRLIVVDKPDAVQTEIRVGQLAIPRKHPDYLAWDLTVKILGGEGANRLHRVLRSERGLTYGAEADTQAMKQAGDFVAETNTRTETTGEALRLTVEEFSKLQRQRVFERELADAQAYLAGSFPLTIETPNDIATIVMNALFYELPLDEISTFRERVQALLRTTFSASPVNTSSPTGCRSCSWATPRASSRSCARSGSRNSRSFRSISWI